MKNKGITLLALIVTVIIMIILAGVSINLITNGGIIDKTRQAAIDYHYQADKERFELAKISATDYLTGKIDEEKLAELLEGWEHEDENWTSSEGNNFVVEEEYEENIPEELKKYVLGEKLQGRNAFEIFKGLELNVMGQLESNGFKNEEKTIADASTTVILKDIYLVEDTNDIAIVLIEYESNYYKFKIKLSDEIEESNILENYGIVKINIENKNLSIGKKINYDEENWIILYDDKEYGLQMISEKVLMNNEGGPLDIYNYFDEKGWPEDVSTEIEKNIYAYNNAIEALNKACEEIVDTTPSYIKDVRCVGSNPKNKNSENNTMYTSEFLENNPIGNPGKYNGIAKKGDLNFEKDFERMIITGCTVASVTGDLNEIEGKLSGDAYWLASRMALEIQNKTCFGINDVDEFGRTLGMDIWDVNENKAESSAYYDGLRPIITLDTDKCELVWDETNEYYTIASK